MHWVTAVTTAGCSCSLLCSARMDRCRLPSAAKAGCTTSLGTARAAPTSPCRSLRPCSCSLCCLLKLPCTASHAADNAMFVDMLLMVDKTRCRHYVQQVAQLHLRCKLSCRSSCRLSYDAYGDLTADLADARLTDQVRQDIHPLQASCPDSSKQLSPTQLALI